MSPARLEMPEHALERIKQRQITRQRGYLVVTAYWKGIE